MNSERLCLIMSRFAALRILVIGDDGNGFELACALRAIGVDASGLISAPDRFTPTYTKPMLRQRDGSEREMNRLDIKNRTPLPAALEDEMLRRLRSLAPTVHAVIVADQVREEDCGVVTCRLREEVIALAAAHPHLIFAADSRKPNEREALHALGWQADEQATEQRLRACGVELHKRCGKPGFLAVGERGILLCNESGCRRIPAWPVSPPIDTVGAGDTTLAALVASLAAGASSDEAATIATLAAAVTIKQSGTTGTATPKQILALHGAAPAELLSSR